MEKSAIKTPETHSAEMIDALKLISEIVVGPEMRLLKDFIRTTDESRQLDLANMDQKTESALAKIREDAMAISADLRHTKEAMETDRKKWNEEIADVRKQMDKIGEDLTNKTDTTKTALLTNLTQLKEQIETNISNLTEDQVKRATDIEGRITQCENESNARRKENSRLAKSLSIAAQSLVIGNPEPSSMSTTNRKQVETLLTKMDGDEPDGKDDSSDKKEMPDFDAVFHETKE